MPKSEKVKVNVKERVEDNVCDLSLSELAEVPVREIATFKRVTILDLSSNRLMTLGKTFTSLTRLTRLDLSKNQIKYLPDEFGTLRNLRHLDLYDNRLEHLPLSFGNLQALRYLDLKGNPLMPALAKIVGHCLTTKDCQNSARNTVRFLAHMQMEAEKAKEKYLLENPVPPPTPAADADVAQFAQTEAQLRRKANKKTKSKTNKKSTNQNSAQMLDGAGDAATAAKLEAANKLALKSNKKNSNKSNKAGNTTSDGTALTSILIFLLLLTINIFVIYMATFKNPELVDRLVSWIPPQYRDWLLTKMDSFGMYVADLIQKFRTPPEDH